MMDICVVSNILGYLSLQLKKMKLKNILVIVTRYCIHRILYPLQLELLFSSDAQTLGPMPV